MIWMTFHVRQSEDGLYHPAYQNMDRGADDCGVNVPIVRAWMEDPDDFHFQIEEGVNLKLFTSPEHGDYVIPNPYAWGDPLIRCYSVVLSSAKQPGLVNADLCYQGRMNEVCYSPNGDESNGFSEALAFERKYVAWQKRLNNKKKGKLK